MITIIICISFFIFCTILFLIGLSIVRSNVISSIRDATNKGIINQNQALDLYHLIDENFYNVLFKKKP